MTESPRVAQALVGKRVQVGQPGRGVKGIVLRTELDTEVSKGPAWQICVWHGTSGKERTYYIDNCYDADTSKPLVSGQDPFEDDDLTPVELRVLTASSEHQLEQALEEYTRRPFIGGCARAKDLIRTNGFAELRGQEVAVWWPGEGEWFVGSVQSVHCKLEESSQDRTPDGGTRIPTFTVTYEDGDCSDERIDSVWRLESTPDSREERVKSQEAMNVLLAGGEAAKRAAQAPPKQILAETPDIRCVRLADGTLLVQARTECAGDRSSGRVSVHGQRYLVADYQGRHEDKRIETELVFIANKPKIDVRNVSAEADAEEGYLQLAIPLAGTAGVDPGST